jgi:hypothetical protein
VGLIQNVIEGAGITTVSATMKPEITHYVRVPRAARMRFPQGNPLGEAGRTEQQRVILSDLLRLPWVVAKAERIVTLPHRWRREARPSVFLPGEQHGER